MLSDFRPAYVVFTCGIKECYICERCMGGCRPGDRAVCAFFPILSMLYTVCVYVYVLIVSLLLLIAMIESDGRTLGHSGLVSVHFT